jgi:RHS repeat-associated protein
MGLKADGMKSVDDESNWTWRWCRVLVFLQAVMLWMAVVPAARSQVPPDKSGVKASVLSLPTGAGSIEGLGESFEPQLNTGGSTYGVTIALPPGRAGLLPSVRLDYNSYTGNGICGIGWSLEFPSIKRQTDKGFPEYDSMDSFVHQGEELVPLNNPERDWRCENERDFSRFRIIDSDADGSPDAWEMTDRNGTTHTFGRFRGQNNRWSVVEHPEKGAAGAIERTYAWHIDRTTDVHGNEIHYEYVQGSGVLYPSRITYGHLGGAFHEVLFDYEDRADAFDDYRPTFSARLARRLTRIEVRTRGELVRAYNLAYNYEAGDLTPELALRQSSYLDLGISLLKRVVQVDRSGNDANYLPPLILVYSGLDLTKAERRSFAAVPGLDLAEPNGRVQIADLDGDGLPDIFSTSLEGAGTVQRVCLNRGETRQSGQPLLVFDPPRQVLGSSPVDLAQPNTLVHDPRAKGLVDLSCLVDDGPNKRLDTFGNRSRLDLVDEDRLGFSDEDLEVVVLQNPPSFVTFSQSSTRQSDVNFDKRGDFVNLEPGFGGMKVNTFYIRRDGTWVSGESTLPPSYPLANTFEGPDGQPNPCVQLADMNGDRMLDLICLAADTSGGGQRISVSYWPLCGLGRYADEREVPNAPGDTFDIGTADLRDVFVEDVTGDGLADIIVLDGSGPETVLTVRVNIAGQRWSPPFTRAGLPRYAPRDPGAPTVMRLADLNGNGSVDLLFRNTAPGDTWDYIELLPAGSPSLLTDIDNSLGRRTTIVYGSAAEDERMARESGHPWRTHAPMALQVVRQIRVSGGQDLNGDGLEDTAVAEFSYRDPYYDGFEREFRGFAFAQRVDYGDDFILEPLTGLMNVSSGWDTERTPTGQVSGPSAVTRYRFYTGAADQMDNDDYGDTAPELRLTDEITEAAGREEEILKGLQWVEEQVDPVVLHSATDGGFDRGCELATLATDPAAQGQLTPDTYVYHRTRQEWTIRRLYRPTEPLPYFADQNADGMMEDYQSVPASPTPQGRFAAQGITVLPGNGRSVSFAFVRRTVTQVREANGLLSSTLGYPTHAGVNLLKTMDYDDYGNLTVERDFGVDDPGSDDERFTTTTYAHGGNALARWIISKPDTMTVTDEHGALVSSRVHFYDGAPLVGVQGQIQDRGLLARAIESIDDTRTVDAVRNLYDVHGNILETRDPGGSTRRITWDPVFQTYPIMETMVVGNGAPDLTMTATYDFGFGVVTASTDFNANPTAYEYDSFARLVKITRPGDTPELPTVTFEYQPADPIRGRGYQYDTAGNLTIIPVPLGSANRILSRQREVPGEPGEFLTLNYTDGRGNALALVEEGETSGTWIVRKASSYNLRLQVRSDWLPYQISSPDVPQFPEIWPTGSPPATDGINPAIVSTDYLYDPLGREIQAMAPPETWEGPRRISATQYLPLRKLLFDEEDLREGSPYFGTPLVQEHDGLQRLIAVEERVRITDHGDPGPLTAWRTEYRYDLNDQLTQTTDSQGNVKRMTYDALRRMTSLNDPDRGLLTLGYDDAGNLIETIDAKGQRIVYTYDGLNRLKTEDYQDNSPTQFDVEYFYDTPHTDLELGDGTRGTARNTRGQIAYVRDQSGELHYSYDARARIEWEVKRIPDRIHGQLVSYQTGFAYDSADRMVGLTYPDGDQVTHDYNSRNLLARIHGASLGDVISSISYQPSGQPSNLLYGNSVTTLQVYDPRMRLVETTTSNGQEVPLIDFAYTFDSVSNLDRIDDRRNLTGLPNAAERANTQIFTYDSLYRLTRVQYPAFSPNPDRQIDYRYDRIGNMLSQLSNLPHEQNGLAVANLGAMESGGAGGRFNRIGRAADDPPGPHALTRITGSGPSRDYDYDANGNLVSLDNLTCEWDFRDRLTAVENAEMRAVYTYDHTSRRVIKTVHWKNPGPEHGSHVSPLNPLWRTTTTHYLNRYFEIREQDAPVKYVWNGETRVARVTASFGAASRVQRLRLEEGWNHVSLTVAGQFSVLDPALNSDLGACAVWSSTEPGSGLVEVTSATSLSAGAILWIYAARDTTILLSGAPGDLELADLTGDSQFLGNTLPEPLEMAALFPPEAQISRYETGTGRWQRRLAAGDVLDSVNGVPWYLLPGAAVWTTGASASQLGTHLTSLRVRYYHQDHLGTTSVMTDGQGRLVEELASYPFGQVRFVHHGLPVRDEPYRFTQKEQDAESGLHYFEARYLISTAGRFASVDPLMTIDVDAMGQFPQSLNLYAYSLNNPIKYVDPLGLEVEVTTQKQKGGGETTKIELSAVMINESSTDFSDQQLKAIKSRIVTQLESSFTGSEGKTKWEIDVKLRIVDKQADIKAKDHVIRIVDQIPDRPASVLGRVNKIGGKELKIRASVVPKKPSDPGNASLERTSSHEVGHLLGLRHDTDRSNTIRNKMERTNLMRQTKRTSGTDVNAHQVRLIQKLYNDGKLNQ